MSFAYNNMINVIGDIMAQYKIAVDAGHGGSDYGATYNGRAEKDDNLKLALAVGDILEKNGIDVVYTRTTDEYETPFKKATDANDAKADYFVSIHRNSSPTPNQYTGGKLLFTIIPVLNHRWLPISILSWKRLALKILELPNVLTLLYSNGQKCLPYL